MDKQEYEEKKIATIKQIAELKNLSIEEMTGYFNEKELVATKGNEGDYEKILNDTLRLLVLFFKRTKSAPVFTYECFVFGKSNVTDYGAGKRHAECMTKINMNKDFAIENGWCNDKFEPIWGENKPQYLRGKVINLEDEKYQTLYGVGKYTDTKGESSEIIEIEISVKGKNCNLDIPLFKKIKFMATKNSNSNEDLVYGSMLDESDYSIIDNKRINFNQMAEKVLKKYVTKLSDIKKKASEQIKAEQKEREQNQKSDEEKKNNNADKFVAPRLPFMIIKSDMVVNTTKNSDLYVLKFNDNTIIDSDNISSSLFGADDDDKGDELTLFYNEKPNFMDDCMNTYAVIRFYEGRDGVSFNLAGLYVQDKNIIELKEVKDVKSKQNLKEVFGVDENVKETKKETPKVEKEVEQTKKVIEVKPKRPTDEELGW